MFFAKTVNGCIVQIRSCLGYFYFTLSVKSIFGDVLCVNVPMNLDLTTETIDQIAEADASQHFSGLGMIYVIIREQILQTNRKCGKRDGAMKCSKLRPHPN